MLSVWPFNVRTVAPGRPTTSTQGSTGSRRNRMCSNMCSSGRGSSAAATPLCGYLGGSAQTTAKRWYGVDGPLRAAARAREVADGRARRALGGRQPARSSRGGGSWGKGQCPRLLISRGSERRHARRRCSAPAIRGMCECKGRGDQSCGRQSQFCSRGHVHEGSPLSGRRQCAPTAGRAGRAGTRDALGASCGGA